MAHFSREEEQESRKEDVSRKRNREKKVMGILSRKMRSGDPLFRCIYIYIYILQDSYKTFHALWI